MSRQPICIALCQVLVLGLLVTGPTPTQAQDPNLMGWWKLDGDALDLSGNDRHGTLQGAPQYIEGAVNEALNFNGSNDYVNIDGYKGVLGTHPWSAGAWIRADSSTNHRSCMGWGNNVNLQRIEIRLLNGSNILRANHGSGNANTQTALAVGEWYHFVLTVIENATCSYPDMIFYLNGVDDTVPNSDPDPLDIVANADLSIGRRASHGDRYWEGAVDEVVLFDKVLTPEEVLRVFEGDILPATGKAGNAGPADKSVDVVRDTSLTWSPGIFAATHNVYLGTAFDDVNDATVTDQRGVLRSEGQQGTEFDPGRLDFGQAYYWRVDEVNGAPDFTVYKGNVWTFSVEPFSIPIANVTVTASSTFGESTADRTIDGSGLTGDLHGISAGDMWISGGIPASITWALDRTYKLHEMWVWNSNQSIEAFIGFGAKDVVIEHSLDGENWTVLDGVPPLAQATGLDGYAHNNTIDLGGAVARQVRMTINSVQGFAPQASLSEVRIFAIPMLPTGPIPESGATDVDADVTLSWSRSGREAASHDILLGTDANALSLAGTVTENSFDTSASDLALGQTYYWQVVEVNDAEDPSQWAGDVWSFSTVPVIMIDDMEGYADAEFREIWATWTDGFDDPANGSLVGNGITGSPEFETIYQGGQSLPMHYDNSAAAQSEATRTFDSAMDWSKHGVQSLVLFFRGDPSNTGGQLYVQVNDTKIAYEGAAADLMNLGWNKWTIPLSSFSGSTLSRVTSMTIGIEGNGSGVLYVDEIQLTTGTRELVTPTQPSDEGLMLHYPFDGDASDSTGNSVATPVGGALFVPGIDGQALNLDGAASYLAIDAFFYETNDLPELTVMTWLRTDVEDDQNIASFDRSDYWRLEINLTAAGPGQVGWDVLTDAGQLDNGSSSRVDDGEWHHVAGVYDNGTSTIYIDGYHEAPMSLGSKIGSGVVRYGYVGVGSESTEFDGAKNGTPNFFVGALDDFRVYHRALSAAEVAGYAGRTEPFEIP